jgi:hypothetical protein
MAVHNTEVKILANRKLGSRKERVTTGFIEVPSIIFPNTFNGNITNRTNTARPVKRVRLSR